VLKEWAEKMDPKAPAATLDPAETQELMESPARLDHLEPWDPVV